ncbi:hypothetical protein ARMGADRAFT_284541 [Armillaria gallica]|uniref:Uncharacterized protein n=1 Tax=Armillaria gallica TaxID=47427 RepID=A0A2H3DJD0_ARMGA|nr:hypothetical protein ARMGADRAFT_284541 [Armillaria gallica]
MSILGNAIFEVQTRVVVFFGRLDNSDLVLAVLLMLATLLLLKKISSGGERFYNRLRMVGSPQRGQLDTIFFPRLLIYRRLGSI